MAGIYHNATLGLISLSSDGSNWITIADKNLGATTVWNSGDTLSEANAGKYYQWGNNYGFPFTGSVTISGTQVDASNYGPGNYYSSSTFIITNDWSSVQNDNLWGATTGTNEAMQGPCPSGFHVPSVTEWQAVANIWTALGPLHYTIIASKLPNAGRRAIGDVQTQGTHGYYWSSSPSGSYAYNLRLAGFDAQATDRRSYAYSIRPFKNEAVVPYANEGWTKLYGDDLPNIRNLKRLQKGGNYYYFKDAPTHASAISLNKSSITLTEAGQTEQLVATITPSDAVDKSIIWTSSNENVATVSSTGLVRCISVGQATITATCDGVSATCNVDYTHVTGVSLNTSTIILSTAGQTYQLTATITPNNAYNKNVTWSSSNTSIATVSSTGLVTCVTPGSATITVTTEDGGYTASCSTIRSRTFTISWTEGSNMSSGWTYSDDAAGLTAGSTAFDEFFGYSAVRLNTSGVETAEVKQTTPGQLNLSSLGTLTSGDNVMIKFPRLGIKMSKSGSTVTLSITNNPNAESNGFQYYAHSRGTLSSPIKKDALYLGAFKAAYNGSNALKSWSGQSPVTDITQQNSINYARANDGNTGSAGYDIIGFYQREFINALYMMKYGNPDCQSVIGKGYTGGSAKVNTGGTVSQTLATYGTTSTTQQVKLFGLEDWWGNINEWIGGMCTNGSKNLWTALSGFVGDIKTTSPYENTGTTIQHTGYGYNLSSIVGSNKGLFAPTATVNNSNYNTYYCDVIYVDASSLAMASGAYNSGSSAGAFELEVERSASGMAGNLGARLMFL